MSGRRSRNVSQCEGGAPGAGGGGFNPDAAFTQNPGAVNNPLLDDLLLTAGKCYAEFW